MKKQLFISSVVIILTCTINVYAGSAGTTIFPMLKINPAARSASLGETYGIVTSQSCLNNPSILPWINEKEISVQHLMYVSQTNYSLLTYVHPFDDKKAISASLGYLGVGGLTKTSYDSSSVDNYKEEGSFGFSDVLVNISAGKKVTYDFSYGVGVKFIRESINTESNFGAMLSCGGFYIPRYENWQINFGVFNIGPAVKNYSLPMGGYLGVGSHIQPGLFWIGEFIGYIDQIVELRTGLEYSMVDDFSIRLGYKYPLEDPGLGKFPDVNLTGGIGFNIGKFSLDYAWTPYGDLGQTHRIALSSRFGKEVTPDPVKQAKKEKVKEDYKKAVLDKKQEKSTKEARANIAVADFRGEGVSAAYASIVSDFLRAELADSSTLRVMDRTQMEMIFTDQEFDSSGCSDEQCAVKMGRILNVHQVIVGSLTRVLKQYHLVIELIDVETGIILKSLVTDAEDLNELRKACRKMAHKLGK